MKTLTHAAVNLLRTILEIYEESFFPHVLSETFIIPFHEPIPAQKRDVELPPQVLGRNPTARAECDSLIDFSAQLCAPSCSNCPILSEYHHLEWLRLKSADC